MGTFNTKKILVGICGGIAAYKVVSLIRLLKKAGAEVKVIMTESASGFVGKVALATVSENSVLDRMADPETGLWTNHVELGLWADLFLIAPATANTMSKMASGQADNLLITTFLSARCPVFIAPAMDLDMWKHQTTQKNLEILQKRNINIIEPTNGPLASGLSGVGRMEEPETIFTLLENHLTKGQDLKGKKALVTLGPTVEAIDPVRFISNHSTGKMGLEIVKSLVERGADVIIVAGPVALDLTLISNTIHKVKTAQEMYDACHSVFSEVDFAILSAAVADYTPAKVANQKIKKMGENMSIELIKTKDIAASLGKIKRQNQLLIGFALETENELSHAKSKLERKNLDAIILNSLNDAGAGFAHDTNKITILNAKGETFAFEIKSKKEVARDITDYVVQNIPKP